MHVPIAVLRLNSGWMAVGYWGPGWSIDAAGDAAWAQKTGEKFDQSAFASTAGDKRDGWHAIICQKSVPGFVPVFLGLLMIRNATIQDVPRMQAVINSHAELGKMLFKSYGQLYENLRDFAVCEIEGEIVGCVGLAILWADLAEVRSLAVDDRYRGRGIGTQLVQWCLEEARKLRIRKIMSLTYEQHFFEKLGFEVVEKETLPLKVWSDCVKCPKNENCDEIAMVRVLWDIPVLAPQLAAPPTPRGVSIPVLSD